MTESNSDRVGLGYSNKKLKNESSGNGSKMISFQKATTSSQVNKSQSNESNTFADQMKEAAERARKIAEQINAKNPPSKTPKSSTLNESMTPEQYKQFLEQKEVIISSLTINMW